MCVIMDDTKKNIKLRTNAQYYKMNRSRICLKSLERYRKMKLINNKHFTFEIEHRMVTITF